MPDIDWKEVRKRISSRIEPPANSGLDVVVMQAFAKDIDDTIKIYANAAKRHILRARLGEVYIDTPGYYSTLSETLGFDRQGITNIDRHTIEEAIVSNVYAASAHLYQSFAALGTYHSDLTQKQLDVEYIRPLLGYLDCVAREILSVKGLLREGDFFSEYLPDRSYSTFSHWQSEHEFGSLKTELKEGVLAAEKTLGKQIKQYANLQKMLEYIKKD
jgi:hypothetical protein